MNLAKYLPCLVISGILTSSPALAQNVSSADQVVVRLRVVADLFSLPGSNSNLARLMESRGSSASGVIIGSGDNYYYILTASHVINGICDTGCVVEFYGSTQGQNSQLRPLALDQDYRLDSRSGEDIVLVRFASESRYSQAEPEWLSDYTDSNLMVYGFPTDSRELHAISSLQREASEFTVEGCLDNTQGTFFIYSQVNAVPDEAAFGDGWSGGGVFSNDSTFVGLHRASPSVENCGDRLGLGVPLDVIKNDRDLWNEIIRVSNSESITPLVEGDIIGVPDEVDVPRSLQMRRDRMLDPNFGGSDRNSNQ